MFIYKHFHTNYKLFRKKEEKSSFSSSTRSTLMIFPLASTAMVSAVSTSVCLSVCLSVYLFAIWFFNCVNMVYIFNAFWKKKILCRVQSKLLDRHIWKITCFNIIKVFATLPKNPEILSYHGKQFRNETVRRGKWV